MFETILLVDDEPALRQLMTRTLTAGGYRVLEAQNAAEALDVFATHQAGIDLVVTDIGMPGWRGPELIEMLRVLHPALKVLVVSGKADPATAHESQLLKPFARAELLAAVQQLLSQPPSV